MENKYIFQFTNLALTDIENALNYIIVHLMNKKAAIDLLSKIETTLDIICTFPYSYPDCMLYFIEDNTVRHAVIDNYILVYKINEITSSIDVLRFKYSKQKELF